MEQIEGQLNEIMFATLLLALKNLSGEALAENGEPLIYHFNRMKIL